MKKSEQKPMHEKKVSDSTETVSVLRDESGGSPTLTQDQASVERIRKRMLQVSKRLEEKERNQLGYVFQGVPIQYYKSWKGEGNLLFSLLVTYSNRLRALDKKPKM